MKTALLVFLPLFSFGQGCFDPFSLDNFGSWSDCWEAPQTFSNDCFDAFPISELCGNQCGGVWLEFETGSTGLATFLIESDMNYDFYDVPDAPELWVHFYILEDCLDPIFFTSGCGIYGTLGDSLLMSSTGEGSVMGVSDDYIITLQLDPFETYFMVVGNVGSTQSVQEGIEGCLEVGYFTQGILGLLDYLQEDIKPIQSEISPNKELYLITDVLGRKTKERLYTVLLYHYTDGTVDKRIIVK